MTRKIFLALLSIGSAIAATAPARAGLQLGERPIRRTEVIATVKQQFAEMDTDHDGTVSPAEFDHYRVRQDAMPDQGRGLTHIGKSWFDRSDADHNGKVTLVEAQSHPLELFDMADANRDGVASVSEQSVAMLFVK